MRPVSRDDEAAADFLRLVLIERGRQQADEGYHPSHDDSHRAGELAQAAAVWATPDWARRREGGRPVGWPDSWAAPRLPKDRRRELVIAAALLVAEWERLDRIEQEGGL